MCLYLNLKNETLKAFALKNWNRYNQKLEKEKFQMKATYYLNAVILGIEQKKKILLREGFISPEGCVIFLLFLYLWIVK